MPFDPLPPILNADRVLTEPTAEDRRTLDPAIVRNLQQEVLQHVRRWRRDVMGPAFWGRLQCPIGEVTIAEPFTLGILGLTDTFYVFQLVDDSQNPLEARRHTADLRQTEITLPEGDALVWLKSHRVAGTFSYTVVTTPATNDFVADRCPYDIAILRTFVTGGVLQRVRPVALTAGARRVRRRRGAKFFPRHVDDFRYVHDGAIDMGAFIVPAQSGIQVDISMDLVTPLPFAAAPILVSPNQYDPLNPLAYSRPYEWPTLIQDLSWFAPRWHFGLSWLYLPQAPAAPALIDWNGIAILAGQSMNEYFDIEWSCRVVPVSNFDLHDTSPDAVLPDPVSQ